MVAEALDTAWVAWATDVAGKQEAEERLQRRDYFKGSCASFWGQGFRDCRTASFHIEPLMPAFGLSQQSDLITPAHRPHLSVISRMVFVPRISRISRRFTAVARR